LNAPSRWQNLGASHLRVVLGLPSPTQERLLAMANSERWSVKVLHEQVLLEKTTRSTRGGRRAQSPITKSLISLKKCLAHYHDLMGRGGHPSPQDAEQVMALLAEASSSLASLTESLQEALGPDTDE
jgi:hypothetical protein